MGSAAHGTYNISAGSLLVGKSEYVGYSGAGTFNQSGGTHTITGNLYLGYNNGSSGTFTLSGAASQLSATDEYIGYSSAATAVMQQTGGTNSAVYLSIGSGGQYQFSGGTLQINGVGLVNQGVFNASGCVGSLSIANGIADLSQGPLQNVGSLSVAPAPTGCCSCRPVSTRPVSPLARPPAAWSTWQGPR